MFTLIDSLKANQVGLSQMPHSHVLAIPDHGQCLCAFLSTPAPAPASAPDPPTGNPQKFCLRFAGRDEHIIYFDRDVLAAAAAALLPLPLLLLLLLLCVCAPHCWLSAPLR